MQHISPEFLKLLDEAYPFKRIKAPQHILDELSKLRGVDMKELAFTVDKDLDEDLFWSKFDATALHSMLHGSQPYSYVYSNQPQ